MMKSVGLVLLLTAAFANSGVEGHSIANACAAALSRKVTDEINMGDPLYACMSTPAWSAVARVSGCENSNFAYGPPKCQVLAAPFMKCVAGKSGYLNADGSINNTKILAQFKTWATSDPKCNITQYDFAVKKCGTTINNYAILPKAYCIVQEV
ncbi:uncharacterized protein LOC108676989 [Hyalella azteca]|uniref:Uncharacterized protein LOC108676989 n=1 Tax=Hyalella azteca TaxID=294128 RepID=A0A8B7P689_HYAAZ|nr:uncharacterized protein LOC108676989 [Hyalella azteca]